MAEEQGTPNDPQGQGETGQQPLENNAESTAPNQGNAGGEGDTSGSNAGSTGSQGSGAVDPKEYEKVVMERNQLRKQTEEAKQKAEEAERKDLENKEEFRQLYEREQQKREEYEQKLRDMEQQKEHQQLRDSVLSEYPDEVRQLADDLGVQLDTSQDEETAKSEYKSKLDKLHERVQGGQQQQQNNEISVDANNPAPNQGQQKTKDDLIKEAQQTGDWSQVLSTIPSVQQQIGQEGDQKQ